MKRQSRGPAREKNPFSSSSRKSSSQQSDKDRSGSDKKTGKSASRSTRNSRSEERDSGESRNTRSGSYSRSGSGKGSPRPSYVRGERKSREEQSDSGYRERRSESSSRRSESDRGKGSSRPSYVRGERKSREEQSDSGYRERRSESSSRRSESDRGKGSSRPSYVRGERKSREEQSDSGYRERRSESSSRRSESDRGKGSSRPSYVRGERKSREEDQPEKSYRERKSPGSRGGAESGKSEWPKKPAAVRKPRAPREEETDLGKYQERKKKHARSAQEYNTLVKRTKKEKATSKNDDGLIRLNKFIANTGLCSRREADTLIESGAITVNGKPVTELGTRIQPTDKVMYGDQTLQREKLVYVLLNKPKDYITTSDDPQQRKTVMELVANATRERIYPVGRLDRNTTGLLLFTNDGELTKKLTHPRHNIKKIYHVVTDQNVSGEHLDQLREGFELEDGYIKVDDVQFVGDASNKRDIGVEIHSGRNRIVRRMFEHLGYKVVRLDRVMFSGLTKKDLPRGKWRFLSEKEVAFLKML